MVRLQGGRTLKGVRFHGEVGTPRECGGRLVPLEWFGLDSDLDPTGLGARWPHCCS